MAQIVIGVACSHSPQLSTAVNVWADHAARDRRNPNLIDLDGNVRSFQELLRKARPSVAGEITPDSLGEKHTRIRTALDTCRSVLTEAAPRLAVMIGNDHHELFGPDAMPAFALYIGDGITDRPEDPARFAALPSDLQAAWWSYHGTDSEIYPVATELGEHLVRELVEAEFDVTQVVAQRPEQNLGHAWTYPRRRLMGEPMPAIVPVHVNTLYPPNRPTPARCYRFGRALGSAIRSWPGSEPVAVITSGGLSHFVVDEQLDMAVLDALRADDEAALAALPRTKLRSGTSEILNWVVAGGALRRLEMEVVDYIPAYRSEAGTGVGMAFAVWRPE